MAKGDFNTYNSINNEDFKADVLRVITEYNDTSLKCYREHGKYSYGAICNHYGKWSNLLHELGFELKKKWKIDKQLVLNDVSSFIETKNSTRSEDYRKYGQYSIQTIGRLFGSWNNILKILGYEVNKMAPCDCSKENILLDYIQECKKYNQILKASEYYKTGKYSSTVVEKIFGSFRKLRESLGLHYFIKAYTEEEIRDILQEAFNMYGPINTAIIKYNTRIDRCTLTNRYGSVKQACQYFNIPYDDDNNPNNSALFRTVYQRAVEVFGPNCETEKTFDWLVYINHLFVDIYYPDLNLVIEVDGPQHYCPIGYFGGESAFKQQQSRDKHKEMLLKNHNINLIRINKKNLKNVTQIFQDYLALTKEKKQV